MFFNKNQYHYYFIFLFLFLITSEFFIPYIFLGEIIIRNTGDFLDSNFLLTKIMSDFYFTNKDSVKLILGGILGWLDYPNSFNFYQQILYYLLGNNFWFINILINSILAFYTFSLLAKKKFNKIPKYICYLAGMIYSCLVYDQGENYQWGLLPYFIYLLCCKEILRTKHYLIVFLIGIASVVYYAPFIYLYSLLFVILFSQKKFNLNLLKLYLIFFIGCLLPSLHIFYNILNNGIEFYHRSDYVYNKDILILLTEKLKDLLYLNLGFNKKTFIFYLPQIAFIWSLYFFSLRMIKDKNIKVYFFNLIFCIVLFDILLSLEFFKNLIELANLKSVVLNGKINYFKYFLISMLFLHIYEILKLKQKKILIFCAFLFVTTYPIQPSAYYIINHHLKNNLSKEDFSKIKNNFLDYQYFEAFKTYILSDTKSDSSKKSLRFTTDQTFEGYYRTQDFKKIKQNFIKNERVLAIGIHPSVLAFNDIKVIGGYFNLYPKQYKDSFLKIIENFDKNYVDDFKNYGTIVSVYEKFNDFDEEYVSKVKFDEAYKMGAKFVITNYKLKNNNLVKVCLNCADHFLNRYKVNIYKIQG